MTTPTKKRPLQIEEDDQQTGEDAARRTKKRHHARVIPPVNDSDLSDEEARRGRRSSSRSKRRSSTESAKKEEEKKGAAKAAEATRSARAEDREPQPGRAGLVGPIANKPGDCTWINRPQGEPVQSEGNLRNRLGAYELPRPVMASGDPKKPRESGAEPKREALPIRKAADCEAYLRQPEIERGGSSLDRSTVRDDFLPANVSLEGAFRRTTSEQRQSLRRKEISALRATGVLNARRAHEIFCHLPDPLLFSNEELIEGSRGEITCRCRETEIKAEVSDTCPPGFWYGQRLDIAVLRDEKGMQRAVAALERQTGFLRVAETSQLTDIIRFIAAVIRSIRDRQTREERRQTVRVRLTAEYEAVRRRRNELGERVEVESGAAIIDFGRTSVKLHDYVQGLARRLASAHLDIADGGQLFVERCRYVADAHNRFPYNGQASASLRHRGWIDGREMHGFYSRVEYLDNAAGWIRGRYLHLAEEAVGYYIVVNGRPIMVKKLRGAKDNPRKKDGGRTIYLK